MLERLHFVLGGCVNVWVKVPMTATALYRWIKIESRWKRKALSQRSSYCYIISIIVVFVLMLFWSSVCFATLLRWKNVAIIIPLPSRCLVFLMPGFLRSVHPYPYVCVPFQKYVGITFIRNNSVAYIKSNVLRCRKFSVSIHSFKTSNRIDFYFFRICSVRDAYTARKRQRRYGTAVRTRFTETDTDERKRNAEHQA